MNQQNQAIPQATPEAAAKPADQALVARQAIYGPTKDVVAYELLYRRSEGASKADVIDGRRATLEVVTNSVLEIGLDRLAGELPIQINYPDELLAANFIVPAPPKRVVIEVLETVRATDE